jgi:RNA polymerase sigma-70 factor (ECF subfamily)
MKNNEEVTNLISKYKSLIYRTCLRYSGNSEDAGDLLQEICVIIWEKFQTFRHEAAVSTWIFRISVNVCLMHQRKSNRLKKVSLDVLGEIADLSVGLEDEMEEDDQWQWLNKKIQALPELDRLVCILYLDGMKYEQIAEILGLSAGNIGARLSRIRTKMKMSLANNQ